VACENEATPDANTEETVILTAVSPFVPILVVERRSGSFERPAPTNNTARAIIWPFRQFPHRYDIPPTRNRDPPWLCNFGQIASAVTGTCRPPPHSPVSARTNARFAPNVSRPSCTMSARTVGVASCPDQYVLRRSGGRGSQSRRGRPRTSGCTCPIPSTKLRLTRCGSRRRRLRARSGGRDGRSGR
jgi:hypothetical protein